MPMPKQGKSEKEWESAQSTGPPLCSERRVVLDRSRGSGPQGRTSSTTHKGRQTGGRGGETGKPLQEEGFGPSRKWPAVFQNLKKGGRPTGKSFNGRKNRESSKNNEVWVTAAATQEGVSPLRKGRNSGRTCGIPIASSRRGEKVSYKQKGRSEGVGSKGLRARVKAPKSSLLKAFLPEGARPKEERRNSYRKATVAKSGKEKEGYSTLRQARKNCNLRKIFQPRKRRLVLQRKVYKKLVTALERKSCRDVGVVRAPTRKRGRRQKKMPQGAGDEKRRIARGAQCLRSRKGDLGKLTIYLDVDLITCF